MWPSATSSEPRPIGRRTPGAVGRRLGVCLAALAVAAVAHPAALISVEEALASAFPGGHPERQTVFLTEDQLDAVERAAGERPGSALVTRFEVIRDGRTIGWAYLDTHRVRTLPETVLVVLDREGSVRRVEVVTFREPLEYLPPDSWYGQFVGRDLDEELDLKRAIRPVIGATLTARATTTAVRRVLAIHEALGHPGDDR